ncbi:MAG: site-2 protease family protein [Chloroflexota bacterium]
MKRYTTRDIIVLAAIAALFIWYFGRSRFRTWEEGVMFIVALVVAVTFHEFAHAFVALRLGDSTAKLLGRVSLNPMRHLDLWGSMTFLFIGFGWGKPVPINPYQMRGISPRLGYAISALAGPTSNVLLAFIATIPVRLAYPDLASMDRTFVQFLGMLISLNIALAAFNFLPIPPLDGFSLARLFLPLEVSAWLERYGMIVLLALVFLPQFIAPQFNILRIVIGPIQAVIESIVYAGI